MTKSFKTILVSLNDKECIDSSLAMATAIARKYDSHITGIYVIPSVLLYEAPYSYGGHITYNHLNKYYRSMATSVEDRFNEHIRREGLIGEWRQINSAGHFISDKVIEHSREADLVVVGENKNFQTDKDFEARLVQSTGRPVLLVPNTYKPDTKLETAMIGWDGSREAARAAFDAIPLLTMCRETEIVSVNSHKEREISGDFPGAELAISLARYDIRAKTLAVKTRKSPGNALLDRAAHADLLVIGAYGHSRLRESILGGVTNSVIEKLPCPVLMVN